MAIISVKATNLESKRTRLIKELSALDVKRNEQKAAIKDMLNNSTRTKDRLFHYDLDQLKQKLEVQKTKRVKLRNSIGRLTRIIKNKHRFETGNLKAIV